jgi:hypothetical protein
MPCLACGGMGLPAGRQGEGGDLPPGQAGPAEKCGRCDGTGEVKITGCPRRIVPAEAWAVLELADLWDKGLPPAAGGVLDQAAAFVEAARFVWAERGRWKLKLKLA